MERFGEKISAEACSGKEIASGFTEEDDDDTRNCGFSRGKPEAGRNELGLFTARYESKSCC